MRANLIAVGIPTLLFAFFIKDAPDQFLDIWFELKRAGKVTIEQYDATWMKFILPRVSLWLMIIVSVQVAYSIGQGDKLKRRYWLQ